MSSNSTTVVNPVSDPIDAAVQDYLTRRDPHWQPEREEQRLCCRALSPTTIANRVSFLEHLRGLSHVAAKYGVSRQLLYRMTRRELARRHGTPVTETDRTGAHDWRPEPCAQTFSGDGWAVRALADQRARCTEYWEELL
jgi:hypothetical protein